MNNNYNFSGEKYTGFRLEKVFMWYGIPFVGVLLTFIFNRGEYEFLSIGYFISVFVTIFVTTINWLGCRLIVIKLWNKYPWHIFPLKHILVEIPVVLIYTIVLNFSVGYFFMFIENQEVDIVERWQSTAVIVILVAAIVSLHEALFFYFFWKENFNKSLSLEKANIKAEYDALKNQINPHFLFNNLNTLITFVEDNQLATNYIQNLAEFLRYTLDLDESDIKTIRNELDLVQKYIYLQKSRFGDNLFVDIDINEKYYDFELPSMSLQMIVDNAIKHNVISKDKPLSIKLFIENNQYLVVENILQKRYGAISTNQGLQNLKKRYIFISEKEIVINETLDKFIVKLPLAQSINN